MKFHIKNYIVVLISFLLFFVLINSTFAGSWEKDNVGYKYKNDDGSYIVSKWEWIDTDKNGILKCYYFNESGYMLSNTTTPDGYMVNNNGEWIENYIVQTKNINNNSNILNSTTNTKSTLTDYDLPDNSSKFDTNSIVSKFKLKCQSLVNSMYSECLKDIKQTSWDKDDISGVIEDFDLTTDEYLVDFEDEIDDLIYIYDMPQNRKNKLLNEGRNHIATARQNLRNKLVTAVNKYNKD